MLRILVIQFTSQLRCYEERLAQSVLMLIS